MPDAPGLHLYGSDLPVTGIDAAGRPTRVDIVDGGWRPTSGSRADPTPYATSLPGFSAPFSIQPDGPATLRLPLEAGVGDRSSLRVALTYMVCTADGRCFPPVVGEELVVPVP